MQIIAKALRDVSQVQRLFVGTFLVYYLVRHQPYTWKFALELLSWPRRSVFSADPVLINQLLPLLLFAWLFTGLWYFIKPKIFTGGLFFLFSYFLVGRLNSYVFILRDDFTPMTLLLLTILLPEGDDPQSQRLKDVIVFLGKFVWVSVFMTGAVAKLDSTGLTWLRSEVIRDFLFFENYLQGPELCEKAGRVALINYIMSNQTVLLAIAVFTLSFELSWPLALFSRRVFWILLLLTFLFQLAVNYFMDIQYWNYWLGLFYWFMPKFREE